MFGSGGPCGILASSRRTISSSSLTRFSSSTTLPGFSCARAAWFDPAMSQSAVTIPIIVILAVMIEAVARLLPGFMGNAESPAEESFEGGLLEAPAYTRPANWRGLEVPPVRIHFLATTSHQHNHMLDSKPTGATWKEAARFPGWTLEIE